MLDLRLINADVLKLRRRRGMLTVAFGLTLGLLALAYLVTGHPARRQPRQVRRRRRPRGLRATASSSSR